MVSKIIDCQRPGIRPLGSLISMIREKVENAMNCLELAVSTDHPEFYFKYVLDKFKFSNIEEDSKSEGELYLDYIFGRLMKKLQVEQRGGSSQPEKEDWEIRDTPWKTKRVRPQPEDENEDPDKIEKPVKKIYPTKQAIHACEIQIKVAGNLLREMKESIDPEKQEFNEDEKEATA